MHQSSAEVELDELADLCASLSLHNQVNQIAGNLLDPIASALDAESAAFRHIELQQTQTRILNLTSIGVASSVSDDYLAHFHRFDPFLDRLVSNNGQSVSNAAFPENGNGFQSYYRKFLQPNGLVHHAGFMLKDQSAKQAWIFNFHRPANAPDFRSLELSRMRLIQVFLQVQAASIKPDDARVSATDDLSILTTREREVVKSVACGYANKVIANRLGISPRTVENHLRNIYEKLHINTRTQLLSLLHHPQ